MFSTSAAPPPSNGVQQQTNTGKAVQAMRMHKFHPKFKALLEQQQREEELRRAGGKRQHVDDEPPQTLVDEPPPLIEIAHRHHLNHHQPPTPTAEPADDPVEALDLRIGKIAEVVNRFAENNVLFSSEPPLDNALRQDGGGPTRTQRRGAADEHRRTSPYPRTGSSSPQTLPYPTPSTSSSSIGSFNFSNRMDYRAGHQQPAAGSQGLLGRVSPSPPPPLGPPTDSVSPPRPPSEYEESPYHHHPHQPPRRVQYLAEHLSSPDPHLPVVNHGSPGDEDVVGLGGYQQQRLGQPDNHLHHHHHQYLPRKYEEQCSSSAPRVPMLPMSSSSESLAITVKRESSEFVAGPLEESIKREPGTPPPPSYHRSGSNGSRHFGAEDVPYPIADASPERSSSNYLDQILRTHSSQQQQQQRKLASESRHRNDDPATLRSHHAIGSRAPMDLDERLQAMSAASKQLLRSNAFMYGTRPAAAAAVALSRQHHPHHHHPYSSPSPPPSASGPRNYPAVPHHGGAANGYLRSGMFPSPAAAAAYSAYRQQQPGASGSGNAYLSRPEHRPLNPMELMILSQQYLNSRQGGGGGGSSSRGSSLRSPYQHHVHPHPAPQSRAAPALGSSHHHTSPSSMRRRPVEDVEDTDDRDLDESDVDRASSSGGGPGSGGCGTGKRGRPRKHAVKIPLPPLYVFIRNMLHNCAYNPHVISWVNESAGTFKVNNTIEFARTWGRMKSNRSEEMNYEKMSRAMRYHYGNKQQGRKGHLAMVKEKRLVYRFGELAINWRRAEVQQVPCTLHDLCRSELCLWSKE